MTVTLSTRVGCVRSASTDERLMSEGSTERGTHATLCTTDEAGEPVEAWDSRVVAGHLPSEAVKRAGI
jgi:hypothetical protein